MDVKILISEKNSYQPREAKIESVRKLTADTYLFRLKNNLGKILPGQFVEASVLGIGESPISVCNFEDSHIELLIRDVGNVTSELCRLKAKDKMLVRGPYGSGYPMEELKNQKITIIAGGTGVAPPRSVIQYIQKNKSKYKNLSIYFGFRSFEDILFTEDIKEWKKDFKVHITLDKDSSEWDGDVGVITKLLEKYSIDKKSKMVLCGPPIMIKFVTQKLENLDTDIFISFERNMKCGVGKCGHCMIHGKYVCTDGPVFRYDVSKNFH